jgi:hypothetical protein
MRIDVNVDPVLSPSVAPPCPPLLSYESIEVELLTAGSGRREDREDRERRGAPFNDAARFQRHCPFVRYTSSNVSIVS